MSEPFPKQRALPGSVELRGREGGDAGRPDPLAELARLVGREDPFRDIFPAAREGRAGAQRPATPAPKLDPYAGEAPALHTDDEDGLFHAPLGQDRRDPFRLPAPAEPDAFADAVDPDRPLSRGEPPPLNADLWAQTLPEPVAADPLGAPPEGDDEAPAGQSTKRTLVVLAAVVALTAGGLGATFLVRGGGGSTASSEVPTIKADGGPIKIQPPDTSNQSTGGDGNTALIEKSASDNVNNAKVVDTQEQPVDLNQLPKAPPATATAAAPANDGRIAVATAPAGTNADAFPQPRKVKTIMIRPDGSVIGEGSAATADGAAAPSPAATTGARPATPKSATRATTTPKPAASSTADGVAAVKPKPAKPPVPAKPKPAPVQAADAGADATASTEPAAPVPAAAAISGSFSVQLAAPGSEQEARDVSSRLQKKFASELDGHAPGIVKADKGGKPVYRVRVSNMSQDDAKSLCTKLQAGGGSCFVVRN